MRSGRPCESSVNIAQDFMRQSDMNLTLNTYSHVRLGDLAETVEQLPPVASAVPKGTAEGGPDSQFAFNPGETGDYRGVSPTRANRWSATASDEENRRCSGCGQLLTTTGSANKKSHCLNVARGPMRYEGVAVTTQVPMPTGSAPTGQLSSHSPLLRTSANIRFKPPPRMNWLSTEGISGPAAFQKHVREAGARDPTVTA